MIQLQLNDNFKTISLLENTRAIYTPIHVKYQKINQTIEISPYEMGNISHTDWIYGNTEIKCHTLSPKKK